MRSIIAISVALVACVACTGIHVRQVSRFQDGKDLTEAADRDETGVRYYEAAPYLLAYPDGKGGVTTKLIYLPDTHRLMSASPYSYFASNTTHMKFNNGILTEGHRVEDATAVPKAAIAAAEKALSATLAAANEALEEPTPAVAPTPRLFRLRVVGSMVHVIGGETKDMDGNDMPVLKVRFRKGS